MTTIDIPASLPYPDIYPINEVNELKDNLCYVIEKYPLRGIGVIVVRKDDNVCIRFSDFHGNILRPDDGKYIQMINKVMDVSVPRIIATMMATRIPKSLYYFSGDDPVLVDMRASLNKYSSPGFLADIFGKQGVKTQKIIGKPILVNDENLAMLRESKGDYSSGSFILKTVKFKSIMRGDNMLPLYGIVTNET